MPVPSGTTESGLQPNFLSPVPFFVFLLSSGVCCGARKIKALFLPFFRLGVGAVCREFEIAQNFVLAGVARGIRMYFIARFGEKNRTFWEKGLIWVYTHSPAREHRHAAFQCGRFPLARCEPFFLSNVRFFCGYHPERRFFRTNPELPTATDLPVLATCVGFFGFGRFANPLRQIGISRWRIHGNFKPFARREPVSWRSRGLLAFRRERFFAEAGRRLFCGICKKWERLRRRQAVSSPCALGARRSRALKTCRLLQGASYCPMSLERASE